MLIKAQTSRVDLHGRRKRLDQRLRYQPDKYDALAPKTAIKQPFTGSGHNEYAIAWYALFVGVHFLVFGRLFHARFDGLGIAMVVATLAEPILLSGLLSAVSLFAVGALAISPRAGRESPDGRGTAGGGSGA